MPEGEVIKVGIDSYRLENGKLHAWHPATKSWRHVPVPPTNAEVIEIRGITRAKEGPFTWKLVDDGWTLERVNLEDNGKSTFPTEVAKSLYLILFRQAEGEPNHWSLFVAQENQNGDAYQVTGDAEYMQYQHEQNQPYFQREDYYTSYVLIAVLTKEAEERLEYWASNTPPPSAPNRAAVKENCQGWSYRVVCALEAEGLVKEETVKQIKSMIEEINPLRFRTAKTESLRE